MRNAQINIVIFRATLTVQPRLIKFEESQPLPIEPKSAMT